MPATPLQLIVNADDFGISEAINDGILHAHQQGILTSTSLLANGAAFEHAISLCAATPSLDVGIHLSLVEERSLLNEKTIPSLTDSEGRLPPDAKVFTRKYFAGQISIPEVKQELEAQIQKAIHAGVKISHLDGHQHLHMLPRVFAVVVELARKYHIPALRIPNEALHGYMMSGAGRPTRVLELLALKLFCWLCRHDGGLSSPDNFAGFFFGGNLNTTNLMTVLQNLPKSGVCEIMCHPGYTDIDNRYRHWGYHWQDELAALTDAGVRDYLQQNNIELVSYRIFGEA